MQSFLQYTTPFCVDADRLWWKDAKGEHKLVIIDWKKRVEVMIQLHNKIGPHLSQYQFDLGGHTCTQT